MSGQDLNRIHDDFMGTLVRMCRTPLVQVFRDAFRRTYLDCESNRQPSLVLRAMQSQLREVPTWGSPQINAVYKTIRLASPHVDDVVEACVDSRGAIYEACYGVPVRTLDAAGDASSTTTTAAAAGASSRGRGRSSRDKKARAKEFVHGALVHAARFFYTEPQRLHKDPNPTIARANLRRCKEIVSESLRLAVYDMVPVMDLLRHLPSHPTACAALVSRPAVQDDDATENDIVVREDGGGVVGMGGVVVHNDDDDDDDDDECPIVVGREDPDANEAASEQKEEHEGDGDGDGDAKATSTESTGVSSTTTTSAVSAEAHDATTEEADPDLPPPVSQSPRTATTASSTTKTTSRKTKKSSTKTAEETTKKPPRRARRKYRRRRVPTRVDTSLPTDPATSVSPDNPFHSL